MPVSLFNRDENTIDTRLLCPESREYLTDLNGFSLPDNLDLEDLCFQINENGNEEPYQDKPQRKRQILDNLLMFENNHKDSCESLHQQAQSKAKKLRLWTIGVTLLTIVLLAVATASILFVPAVAAFTLPLFAVISTAIGSWSPLLLLTSLLPSLAVLIPSLISAKAEHKSQIKLDASGNVSQEIKNIKADIEVKAAIAEFSISSSQIKTLERSSSETISEKRNLGQGSGSSFFRSLPSVRSSDQAIECDLINLHSASL
ncbi:hypothetical protein [Rickettsiella endosymbiont of Miltochrista miniata]|uniref:hypothetical protein n=1 Tax=Rickettsiella endosymbiont of Miltochrista miniata TaxID=3066239 RepID=UPI00313E1710